MKVSFQLNEDSILIKYIDLHLNVFKCIIDKYDPFVSTFCGKKMEKLNNILQNHIIQEIDDYVILKVSEPVELEYILRKEKFNENEAFILSKIESMEERIRQLEDIIKSFTSTQKHIRFV